MMDEKMKQKIDSMSYREMLSLNRFAPIGHPMFSGEVGDYFMESMKEKRESADHVADSKSIGWE
jgi:hypothetical protein